MRITGKGRELAKGMQPPFYQPDRNFREPQAKSWRGDGAEYSPRGLHPGQIVQPALDDRRPLVSQPFPASGEVLPGWYLVELRKQGAQEIVISGQVLGAGHHCGAVVQVCRLCGSLEEASQVPRGARCLTAFDKQRLGIKLPTSERNLIRRNCVAPPFEICTRFV
jgi:hypothetical protein